MVYGQSIFNSPYTIYGIGVLNERTSALNQSLGGTGYGIQHLNQVNYMNPASLTSIQSPLNHAFDVGMYTEQNTYLTSSKTETGAAGGLSRLNYWFRLKPWWAASLGLSPFSSVSYSIKTQRDLAAGTNAYRYEGSGNTSQLYFSNGFALNENLSVGISGYYLFGSISRTESIISTEQATGLTLEDKLFTRKFNFDAGVQYKMKIKKNDLIFGLVYEPGVNLSGTSDISLTTDDRDTLTSYTGAHTSYKIPSKLGGGVSFKTRRSLIAMDLRYQRWSQSDYSDQDIQFQDTWRISGGYSYEGNPNADNYWGVIGFRVGGYYQQYPLILQGNSLPYWGYSAGIALPVFGGGSTIQLTYSSDQLGMTGDRLVKQRSQKISLDLSVRNLWGIRRKFD